MDMTSSLLCKHLVLQYGLLNKAFFLELGTFHSLSTHIFLLSLDLSINVGLKIYNIWTIIKYPTNLEVDKERLSYCKGNKAIFVAAFAGFAQPSSILPPKMIVSSCLGFTLTSSHLYQEEKER